jgi:hypothetical protein
MRLGWRKAITRRHPGYVRTKVFGEISIGWQNSCFIALISSALEEANTLGHAFIIL